MNFDIKLRQELYTYGYILRVISHNDQNLDLVSYLYDSKISIISGSSHEKSQMVYLADSMLIKKDQWMPIQIQFFPNSAKIKINGKNIYLSHSFRDFNDVQIIFGASNLGRFFSGDVAPMSIRNLSLQSLQGKTFYYWKLDRSSKTTNNFVYDSISDLPAYVKNGKWEIDKHYHWQRVTSFEIDYKNPQLAFDEIKGNFFVASDKKLYTYNVNNKTLDTLSFKGAPFLGVSSQMLFHPLKKTLLSYNIYHNKLNWFNPTTSSWSVNQKITVDDNQHHNRFFDKDPAPAKQEAKKAISKPVVNRTVRVDIEKLDNLMNLVSELIIAKNSLVAATMAQGSDNNSNVNEQIEYLESVTTNIHESVMKVRMVPIESIVSKFPRMIRDLSKKLDKKMELYMTGEDTELDRTVVDEIGDPLMHMLRNSADHGLEPNDVRVAKGKPEVGSIFLDAYQDGNNVVIEVRDDGAGIDTEAVKAKAIERGTITAEQAESMTEKEVIDLLFLPSFSTAKKVTDVSGRGVGLDVVKSKIESLSGEVEVKTKLGEGSTFIVRLPLTLAIIQALMVVIGNEKYAISLGSIQTIEDISPEDIKLVQAKEVIHIRGTVIPIIRMNKILDIESSNTDNNKNLTVIIVKKGDKQAGLVVDELIGQQEIVIKSMGKYIKVPKMISGATILGNGEVALILDANALI